MTFRVRENVNKNTEVGNLQQQLRKQGTAFTGIPRFKMLEEERSTDLFKIARRTGVIRTYSSIDREKLCDRKPDCFINFLVRVTNSSMSTGLVKVFISIDDENDNAPEFPLKKTIVQVPEATNPDVPTMHPIQLPMAEDRDTNRFGIKEYKLEQDEKSKQYLSLVTDTQAGLVLRPRLVMRKALDREEQGMFHLKLVAIDGGGKSGSTEVIVEVTDINDNPPQWKTNPIQANVRECDERNTQLVELQATDKDIGINGRIEYRISKYASSFIQQSFYVHENKVILSHGLNYEKQKFIKIPVEAIDGGRLTAEAMIHLRVQDCNDNKPIISIIKEDNGPSILENDSKKKILATVVVRDMDTGANGEVSCHLDKDVLDKFILHPIDINPKTYEVHNAPQAHFDREREPKVSVRINCEDGGEPRNRVTKEFFVTVLDLNDNAPKFEQKPFRFSVAENMDYNTLVGTVKAVDKDVDQNARLSYYLDNEGNDSFRINQRGQLYTMRSFDREKKAQYSFKVFAKDHGSPPLTSEVTVHVNILDVNDCRPRFNKSVYVFNVVENNGPRASHRFLGKLEATDEDVGQNGTVYFKLQSPTSLNKVTVTQTGYLSIEGVIDRERQPDFNFDVVAYDGGMPSLSSVAMVKVNILDINDNSPSFSHPREPGLVVNISKPTTVGSTITTVTASDPDYRENGTVTYSIQRPVRPDLFKLDDTTGTLILLRPIEKESHRGPWRLTLKASDGGGKSSLTTLTIRLVNGRGRGDPNRTYGMGGTPEDNSNMTILYALAAIVFAVFIILFFVLVMFYLRCCNCKGESMRGGGGEEGGKEEKEEVKEGSS